MSAHPSTAAASAISSAIVESFLRPPRTTSSAPFERNLRRAGVPKVVIGQPIPRSGNDVHAADNYLACLRALGIVPDRGSAFRLTLSAQSRRRAAEELTAVSNGRALVGMLPGSGSLRKNWPKERFLELAKRLIDRTEATVFVFLGPAEGERGDADFWRREREDGMTLIVEQGLVEVASLLAQLDVFVGCDSGLSHLAGALGTPVVALFGPTDPAVWAPRGSRVRVVVGDDRSIEGISVESVCHAVMDALPPRGPAG